ncbi:MAG: LacI family DNA-binding transcriptional regulator [Planctomycetota bacterium]
MSSSKIDPPSLQNIADACGLSCSSVSRALNHSADKSQLNPRTWARVRRVAKKMGYQVNAHARALSSGRSNTAGLVFSGAMPMFDGVYQGVISAFTEVLSEHDYQLALVPLAPRSDLTRALSGWMLDGCVSMQSLDPVAADVFAQANMPCILINGRSAGASGSVSPDDRRGAREATEYLLGLGHRKIAMVADLQIEKPHFSLYERRVGFESAMKDAGLSENAIWIAADHDEAAARLTAPGCDITAVVCYSQYEAAPLLGRLQAHGRRVPQDISFISFNDVFPVGEMYPAVTAVSVPSEAMGRAAAEMLLRQIRMGRPDVPSTLLLQESLIERQSTARAADAV